VNGVSCRSLCVYISVCVCVCVHEMLKENKSMENYNPVLFNNKTFLTRHEMGKLAGKHKQASKAKASSHTHLPLYGYVNIFIFHNMKMYPLLHCFISLNLRFHFIRFIWLSFLCVCMYCRLLSLFKKAPRRSGWLAQSSAWPEKSSIETFLCNLLNNLV